MKLTKRTIDAATYSGDGNARCVLWDDEIPGFGLRIFPSGKRSFVLSYRTAGRKRLMTIGTYGVLTLDQARTQARAEPSQGRDARRGPTSGAREGATRRNHGGSLCGLSGATRKHEEDGR